MGDGSSDADSPSGDPKIAYKRYGTDASIKVDSNWDWKKKTLIGVIARGGKSKNFDHLLPLDGGTVGIAHYAARGLNHLYNEMGDELTKKYFGKTVEELKRIDCRGTTPSGKNDNGTGCYSKDWWKKGMLEFLKDPNTKKIQQDAWNKNYGDKAKEYADGKSGKGWNSERSWAIAAGIKNSTGMSGLRKHGANKDPEEALVSYAGSNKHRIRRARAINTVFPLGKDKK